jgi:hypothetical protein
MESGQGLPTLRVPAGVLGRAPPELNEPFVHTTQTEHGSMAWTTPDSHPTEQTLAPSSCLGPGGCGCSHSNPGSCSSFPGQQPQGGLTQCHVSGGPGSVLGQAGGWSGPQPTKLEGAEWDPAPAPPSPCSCAGPNLFKVFCSCSAMFPVPPRPSSPPCRAWQTAGTQARGGAFPRP